MMPEKKPIIQLPSISELDNVLGRNTEKVNRELDEFQMPYMDPNDYRFQLKLGQDNDKLRAQDQGFWETLGIKAANFIPNVLTGMGEMAGYIGALVTEKGDERDYTNALTELMQSWKNPFGEIYKENPNQVIDMTDSAWWIDNVGSLLESATQFALPAAGIGKVFSNLAKAAAWSRNSGLALDAVAQTGTAASLAYMEGAMSGYRIYESTYNNQYRKGLEQGMSGEEAHARAKHMAADAASTTVQMNTLMNTALNMTALAPLFRNSEDNVMRFMRNNARRQPGETAAAFSERITNLAQKTGLFRNREGITSLASEAFQEGVEEVNTQYAEQEGTRVGEGKKRSLYEALTDFDTALKDVSNEEGILNFALGALGGVAQTVMLDNIPVHKVLKEGTENEYTRVSSRTLNADGTPRYFNNLKEAIAADFDWHDKKMQELKAANDKGDKVGAELIKRDMFNVLALNAVQLGMGENWINTFKQLSETPNTVDRSGLQVELKRLEEQAATDPALAANLPQEKLAIIEKYNNMKSEAVERGLSSGAEDNTYRERALDAIEDIRHYQKLHDDIYSRYNSDEEQALGVADFLFQNAAHLYSQQKVLDRGTLELDAMKAEHAKIFGNLPARSDSMFLQAAAEYADNADTYGKIMERIRGDINEFNNALQNNDEATLSRLLEKYRILGEVGSTQVKKMKESMDRQYKAAEKGMQDAMEKLEQSTGYEEYKKKEPKATLEQYMKKLNDNFASSRNIKEMEIGLKQLSAVVESNRTNVARLMSDGDNTKKVISKLKPEIEKRNREVQEKYRNSEVQRELEKNAAAATAEMNAKAIERKRAETQAKIDALKAEYNQKVKELEEMKQRLVDMKMTRKSIWDLAWKAKMALLVSDIRITEKELPYKRANIGIHEDYLNELGTGVPSTVTSKPVTPNPPESTSAEITTVQGPAETAQSTSQQVDPVIQAAEKYDSLLHRLPGEVHPIFVEYEEELKGGKEHDAEAFMNRDDVKRVLEEGYATARGMRQTADALAEYVKVLPPVKNTEIPEKRDADQQPAPEVEETVEDPTTETEEKWDKATQVEKLSDPNTTGTPETRNAPDIETARPLIHAEDKAVSTIKVNNSSLEYVDFQDKKKNYRMAGKELNPNLPEEILNPSALLPGTQVRLELDTEFKGTVRQPGYMNMTKEVTFQDYLDPSGNVVDFENVPIKILTLDEKVIGYLPTMEWLTDKYAGTDLHNEGYRNIVAEILVNNPDGSASTIDNLAAQKAALTKLRSTVAGNKATSGTPVVMTINQKGPGKVIMNMTAQKDGTWRPVKAPALSFEHPETSMLPDPSLKLAKIQNGQVYTGKNYAISVSNSPEQLKAWDNAPVVVLPMANGSMTVAPLYMPDLSDGRSLATIERAIWLYLKSGDKDVDTELDNLYKDTGLDLRNAEVLRQFITSQFTHLSSFDETATALNPDKDPRFLFNITSPVDGKARIMVGWANSGQRPVYANLSGGALNKDFVETLREGLATRQRNVNYSTDSTSGINNSAKFTEIAFNGTSWKTVEYDNYNQYIKANATTYVYGRNQQNGKYRYAANPMITMDPDSVKPVIPENQGVQVVEVPKETPPPLSTPEIEDIQNMLGDIYNSPALVSVSSITPGESMQPVTLGVLQELYNFTPVSKRNGMTPEQVYRDMLRQGLPYLADGHNPFIKCG